MSGSLRKATLAEHQELGKRIAREMIEANYFENRREAIARVVKAFRAEVGAAVWDPAVLRAEVTAAWAGHTHPPKHLLDDVFAGLARA
jgi:hypothetical protein